MELVVVPGVVVPGVAELVAAPKIPLNNDLKPLVNQVNNVLTPVKTSLKHPPETCSISILLSSRILIYSYIDLMISKKI
ncbi:hypothetical protein XF_1307 [Xylella fastidiosa 9a5c]|uniref:Uncharacterized protein n=1 Tax=Xylella fastidiosa (strain 9a5c) TaxID=160492 RepID=Q9PDS2_XYLFA|nr:hypothetical protein XF_1307 [Xylella fastidiosa 9a5c]